VRTGQLASRAAKPKLGGVIDSLSQTPAGGLASSAPPAPLAAGNLLARRTKIVATLGPATDAPGVLDALVAAGLDCARLNCSHGTGDDLIRRAREVRAAAGRAGRPLGLMFDLQGPKLRLAADTVERNLVPGDVIVLSGENRASAPDRAVVDFHAFARLVTERSEIVVGDGVPRLTVERTEGNDVVARTVTAGRLLPRKGINVTYSRPELPAITDKDIVDLVLAIDAGADFVAMSFVRSGADIEDLRARLREGGSQARIIAKIESIDGYENLDDILAAADGVMIARGDYGVTAGLAGVPLMQKDTIRRATLAGKLTITATQMLESMITAGEPTRAEVADVANAVIDGTSAVMLSAESSVGQHPVEAVRTMSTIATAAEQSPDLGGYFQRNDLPADSPAAAVMHAAVQLADGLDAAAIIVPTMSGGAPRVCSRYRPRQPIIALAHDPVVVDQLSLEWGVYPIAADVTQSLDDLVETALLVAREFAGLAKGDRVVLTMSRQPGTVGATNVIVEQELP
jgi:pyruvate kinase